MIGTPSVARKLTFRVALECAALCALAQTLLLPNAHASELAMLRNGFSIRHEHRLVLGDSTRLFLSADDSSFTDVPTAEITGYEEAPSEPLLRAEAAKPASQPSLTRLVDFASATYRLDPDLVNSVIHAESGFNSHAISPKGARGLMQLMPSTASRLGVNDVFDPQSNVTGGSRYLRELLERYNFDLVKALAAYNAGPQRVEQYGGVPPFRETRSYVARIVHEYNQKKIAEDKEAASKQASARASAKAHSTAASKVPKRATTRLASNVAHNAAKNPNPAGGATDAATRPPQQSSARF